MLLKFLGLGAAFNPYLNNTSAYIIVGDTLYLFDCGENVFKTVVEKKLIEIKNIKIMITHTHCDHIGSLGTFVSYCYYVQNGKKVEVIHPNDRARIFLDVAGTDRSVYNYNYKLEKNDLIKIEAFEVQHAKDMKSYGYLIEFNNRIAFYSGDCFKIPDSILFKYLNNEIHEIYIDTSSKINEVHNNINNLLESIPFEKRPNVYCMHLDKDFRDDIKKYNFGVINID